MTVVFGTAGHIDHGKTTLLRALTGIDADRLPEERRRGMTIDVGYAHFALDDGTELDFVDVPGHDRLVGNMLVGAGEIDAALLVVAADDGPRAQTVEHVALLDALGVTPGVVAISKADLVPAARLAEVADAVAELLGGTSLAGSPVVPVSGSSGHGIEVLREALLAARDRVLARAAGPGDGLVRLSVDRLFAVRGRGTVVTGTLRGGPLEPGASLRVEPAGGTVRVRGLQVHGRPVDALTGGGRAALNVAGDGLDGLGRGSVLTTDPRVRATDRLLVGLDRPLPDRARLRLHLGTAAAEAAIGRSGRDALDLPDGSFAATVRLDAPVAAAAGDRFVLRRAEGSRIVGGRVLDPAPARGVSRRRQTVDRVAALAAAIVAGDEPAARSAAIDLHGIVAAAGGTNGPRLAPDVREAARRAAEDLATGAGADTSLAALRAAAAGALRRAASVTPGQASALGAAVVDELVAGGRLVRDGDRVRAAGKAPAAPDPGLLDAMTRLEAALDVLAPPPLAEAAARAACPPAGVRELERSARIVVVAPDLGYAMTTYRRLAATALELAGRGPLSPAAFRDATGTSRKYVMPILEDLDRRGLLRRTPAGHVPGPRAPVAAGEAP
ncbi:MAG TPA: selenocysteine-specific translation elongation factor [Clostridia bacterium]|nr:selenocysteine-specific translation elongation factor [Clostridia bacterium]